jgi:hypothetical protein
MSQDRPSSNRFVRLGLCEREIWRPIRVSGAAVVSWITLLPDTKRGRWSYDEPTLLEIKGQGQPFGRRDTATHEKIAEPTPNPTAKKAAAGS